MAKAYDNKVRENIRVEFAKHRDKGHSIKVSSELAGISPSTFYAWNKGDVWLMKGGWSKGGGSKGKGGGSKNGW